MNRGEAISKLRGLVSSCPLKHDEWQAVEVAIEALKEERPHGEWRDFSDEGFVECPFCEHATNCDDNIEELHYCFFCGAELRKEGEKE